MTCELCQRCSPRHNSNLRCCQIRLIANMPAARRQAVYAQVLAEEGDEAVTKLKAEVAAEYKRIRARMSPKN